MKKTFTLQRLTAITCSAFLLLACIVTLGILSFFPAIQAGFMSTTVNTTAAITILLVLTTFFAGLLIYCSTGKTKDLISQLESAEKKITSHKDRFKIREQLYEAILAIQIPEAVAHIAVNYLHDLAPWESVSVCTYDFEEQKSFLLSAKFRAEPIPQTTRFEDITGFNTLAAGRVFRKEQSDGSGSCNLYSLKFPLTSGLTLIGSIDISGRNNDEITDHFAAIEDLAGPLTIAIQNTRLFTAVEKQQSQLRSLSARLTEMEEAERKKIAVELHDRVGQNLSALNINLNIVKSRMRGGLIDGAEICIADSFLLIEETTEQIRDIMSDLRPPNLDDHGLVAAVRWHAAQRTRRTGLIIEVKGDGAAPRQPLEIEMVLFRIAQEALNNIIKHAKAHTAKVVIESNTEQIRMIISDDGIGFNAAEITSHQRKHSGLGLIAMKERVSALGGTFSIESSLGNGSQVITEVYTYGDQSSAG